ncbi:putative serine O-acetyltransferase [Dioscorea sansibarensis]
MLKAQALPPMSVSILSSPIVREVHRSPATHLKSIMATCVDNHRPKPAMNHLCMNPTRSKIEDSLYRYVGLSRPGLQDLVFSPPASPAGDETWGRIREEAREDAEMEPVLRKYYEDAILLHGSLESALARHLAAKLGSEIGTDVLEKVFREVLESSPEVGRAVRADLKAARDRDPACTSMARCLLYYKGFQACQAHRIIGAGSVVLKEVPARATAVGNPARVVGVKANKGKEEEEMPGISMDHSSWSDYVI